MSKKRIETIADLTPDPMNANEGIQRGHQIIEHSLRNHGAGRSGLAANDGTMIAGNQTLTKIAELGFKIKPVHTKGDEWVVVIRDDIESGSEDAKLLALEDNRASEVGLQWRSQVLADVAQELDVSHLFYPQELAVKLSEAATDIIEQSNSVNPGDLWKGMPEFDQEDLSGIIITVHFSNETDKEAFFRKLGLVYTEKTKSVWYPDRPENTKNQTGKGWVYSNES